MTKKSAIISIDNFSSYNRLALNVKFCTWNWHKAFLNKTWMKLPKLIVQKQSLKLKRAYRFEIAHCNDTIKFSEYIH